MNILGQLFDLIFVNPTINGLLGVYKVLDGIHMPYTLGFSIIVLTVLIRLLLYPMTSSQLRMSKKMQDMHPELSLLKDRHKGDAKRLQQETMSLYKKHGVNPLSGCLPTLVQFLIFPALYTVFIDFVSTKPAETIAKFNSRVYFDFLKIDSLGDPTFFGLHLGKSPSQLLSDIGPLILLVPVLTALFQFLQSKMMFSKPKADKAVPKKGEPDFASTFQTQMIYLIPFTIGFAAFNFPIGLSLYWNTFTFFAIIQQYLLHGLGGLQEWKDRLLPSPVKPLPQQQKKKK